MREDNRTPGKGVLVPGITRRQAKAPARVFGRMASVRVEVGASAERVIRPPNRAIAHHPSTNAGDAVAGHEAQRRTGCRG